MAAAVVELADLARRRAAVLEHARRSRGRARRRAPSRACCRSSRRASRTKRASARNSPSESHRRWFSDEELLHVLGRRPAGAGLEQAAAVHQRHDREHLRARPELEDREQVGQVVAQHVAGHRDRVLARAGALEREPGRGRHIENLDLEPVGVELSSAGPHLRQQLRVVSAGLVEPEHRRAPRSPARASTASRTQSWIGASLHWHMRQMSPVPPRARAASRPRRRPRGRCPAAEISNVLSCEPYSSACCAISPTFGVVPIVAGSNAPCSRQWSTVSAYSGAYE